MSLRDQVASADDRGGEIVDVPEWGVKLEFRPPTLDELAPLVASFTDLEGNPEGLGEATAKLLVLLAYEPDSGAKVFTDDDVAMLREKSGAVLVRLSNTAQRFVGLTEEAVEEGKGGS